MSIVRYAVLNDVHFPYESSKYHVALKRISAWGNLAGIFFNGDIGEFESVSTHPKGPTAATRLRKELDYINGKFDYIQKTFADIPVTLVCGNHSYRIFRYVRDVAPEMWGVVPSCPKLLRFDERPGWKFVDYGPSQLVRCGKSDLWLRHEPLAGGANHAKGTAEKSYVSILYGHTHVYQQYTHKKFGPRPIIVTATSGGWLGDPKHDVFDYRGSKDNWVQGFSEVECDERTGEYELYFRRL